MGRLDLLEPPHGLGDVDEVVPRLDLHAEGVIRHVFRDDDLAPGQLREDALHPFRVHGRPRPSAAQHLAPADFIIKSPADGEAVALLPIKQAPCGRLRERLGPQLLKPKPDVVHIRPHDLEDPFADIGAVINGRNPRQHTQGGRVGREVLNVKIVRAHSTVTPSVTG